MKTNTFKMSFTWLTVMACILFNSVYAQSYQLSKEIPGLPNPQGLTVDALGKICIADNFVGIMVFDQTPNMIFQWGALDVQPTDIACNSLNEFYVVGTNSTNMYKFNDQGLVLGMINVVPGTSSVAVDAQNFIYTVGQYPFIDKYNPTTGAKIASYPLQDPTGMIKGISVDPSGNIYVTNMTPIIQKFNSAGAPLPAISVGPAVFDVTTDLGGNVYTFSSMSRTFYKYSTSGGLVTQWVEPTVNPSSPACVHVDKNGLVYLSTQMDAKVRVYSPLVAQQSITTTVNSPLSFCPGSNLTVSYSISGTFNAGNVFTAQLSNSTGSFASPTTIGSISSISSSSINCTLPASLPSGFGYRVRVISSNPNVIGTANGVNLTIVAPAPVISGPTSVCPNTNVSYSVVNNAGSTYLWEAPVGITVTGLNTATLGVNFTTIAGTFKLRETNSAGCSTTVTRTITMGSLPNSNLTVTGPVSVCPGQLNVQYSVANPVAGATYSWTLPSDVTVVSGAGTANLVVNWGTSSGTVKVSEVNGCGTGTAKTVAVALGAGYSLSSFTTPCGAGFCLPLKTIGAIKSGLIGLDFFINYNSALVTPSGTATLGSVVTSYGAYSLNTATPGKVYVSIYLNNAPANTFFAGNGDVICVNFTPVGSATHGTLLNFTTDAIEESSYIGTSSTCNAVAGKITLTGAVAGKLIYRNVTDNFLFYNSATPSQYLPTDIYATDVNCVKNPSYLSRPDLTGKFNFGSLYGTKVTLERDIPGDYTVPVINCSNIQSVINGSDNLAAVNIANYKTTSPTLYELLSADVNLDGKVTSGDASLISSRSINAINCEFPQAGNYVWNGSNYVPATPYTKSQDWLFIDDATLTLPQFTFGFGRNNVPKVPKCLPVPTGTPTCSTAVATTTYHAVLLGDVNGSWLKTDGNKLKISKENSITIDLENSISNGGNQLIPVYYSGVSNLEAIDFTLDFNSTVTIVNVLSNLGNAGNVQFNAIENKRLMVTATLPEGLNTGYPIMYIEVKTDQKLTEDSFGATSAGYLNGESTELTFKGFKATGISNAENMEVLLFPNPSSSTSIVNVKVQSPSVELSILNSTGIEVYVNRNVPSHSNFILPELEPGIYFVKIIGANGTSIQKMVRN